MYRFYLLLLLWSVVVYGCQTERAKSGRETCSGLDEAGNDLGDISLGFFLRQVCTSIYMIHDTLLCTVDGSCV